MYFFSGDTVDEYFSENIDRMLDDQDMSYVTNHLRENFTEVHFNMRIKIQNKLVKFLHTLLHIPQSDKYYWWFVLFLDPFY